MSIEFRKVEESELIDLHNIVVETFTASFAHLNDPDDFNTYVAQKLTEAHLHKELSNPDTLFYFLIVDGSIAGYLKLNRLAAQSEQYLPSALEIERIYLTKQNQGRGLGKLMIDKAMKTAEEENCTNVWLGVWQKNEDAIRFYKREGFEVFDKHTFLMGSDPQIDLMMKRSV